MVENTGTAQGGIPSMLLVARYSSTKHLRSPLSMRTLLCALHNPRRGPVLEIAYPEDNTLPPELDL